MLIFTFLLFAFRWFFMTWSWKTLRRSRYPEAATLKLYTDSSNKHTHTHTHIHTHTHLCYSPLRCAELWDPPLSGFSLNLESLTWFLARNLQFRLFGTWSLTFSHKYPDCMLLQRAPIWPGSNLLLHWDCSSKVPAGFSSCLGYLLVWSCGCCTLPVFIICFECVWFFFFEFCFSRFSFFGLCCLNHPGTVPFVPFCPCLWGSLSTLLSRKRIWNLKLHSVLP